MFAVLHVHRSTKLPWRAGAELPCPTPALILARSDPPGASLPVTLRREAAFRCPKVPLLLLTSNTSIQASMLPFQAPLAQARVLCDRSAGRQVRCSSSAFGPLAEYPLKCRRLLTVSLHPSSRHYLQTPFRHYTSSDGCRRISPRSLSHRSTYVRRSHSDARSSPSYNAATNHSSNTGGTPSGPNEEYTPQPLNRSIGLPDPPQEGENSGVDTRSWRQRRDDFLNWDKHLARRREL